MVNRNVRFGLMLAIVGATLTIFNVTVAAQRCKLHYLRPIYIYSRDPLENFISPDKRAIANFIGFLGIPDEELLPVVKNKFLQLELDSISQEGTLEGGDQAVLKLSTNCADIKMIHVPYDNNPDQMDISIEIENVFANQKLQVPWCKLSTRLTFNPTKNSFYSCRDSRIHPCIDSEENILALFVFEQLEFEIDGNPDIIEQGGFSKGNYTCTPDDN